MPRIAEPLYWDENNLGHLWESHRVSADEVEEVLFGIDGEPVTYRQLRDGKYLKVFGETASGRLLKMVGEFTKTGRFRVFAAQDMNDREKRAFRGR